MLRSDHEFEERLADRVRSRPAEGLLGRRVDLDDESAVVDDHDTVECGAKHRVLARFARRECALRALTPGHVHHQRENAEHLALCVADRSGRDVDVDQRPVAVQPAHVEVADRLSLAHAVEVREEQRELVLGNEGAAPADRFVRRPPEHLDRARVPRTNPAVEVEVRDRDGGGVDQRAVMFVRSLDLVELSGLLERGRGLVRERPQDLEALRVGAQAVEGVVGPDIADPATATVVQRHEQPVVLPGVWPAAVALRAVAGWAVR